MAPLNPHRRTDSQPTYRTSILPNTTGSSTPYNSTQTTTTTGPSTASNGPSSMSTAKQRQYAHLHSQLAQLNANLADTENLLRMTAVQAGDMRFLGGYGQGREEIAVKIEGDEE
ncbi:unnamed protein product [Penicillium pancosmium]